jgi:hypothetical protein
LLRQANNSSSNAIMEVFLANCLGGRAQPIGNALDGSSIIVPAGAEYIAGLPEALAAHKAAEAAKPKSPLAKFAGTYGLLNTDTVVSLEDSTLFIQVPGQDKGAMKDIGGGKFSVAGSEAVVTFDVNGDAVTGLTLVSGGKSYPARRK